MTKSTFRFAAILIGVCLVLTTPLALPTGAAPPPKIEVLSASPSSAAM